MNIHKQIENIISLIKEKLIIVNLIPTNFEPIQTPSGIDLDSLETLISEFENNVLSESEHDTFNELNSFDFTLKEYIKLFSEEIKALTILEYTTPKSVHTIMDYIGTKGVNNTENGLCVFSDNNDLKLNKGDWIAVRANHNYVVSKEEKNEYDLFIEKIS
jgi:hypothetical protein